MPVTFVQNKRRCDLEITSPAFYSSQDHQSGRASGAGRNRTYNKAAQSLVTDCKKVL